MEISQLDLAQLALAYKVLATESFPAVLTKLNTEFCKWIAQVTCLVSASLFCRHNTGDSCLREACGDHTDAGQGTCTSRLDTTDLHLLIQPIHNFFYFLKILTKLIS